MDRCCAATSAMADESPWRGVQGVQDSKHGRCADRTVLSFQHYESFKAPLRQLHVTSR